MADVNHILVIRGGAIGDFVLTLPAIASLRSAFPEARMTLVSDPRIGALSGMDDILDHGQAAIASLYSSSDEIHPSIWGHFERVDLAVVYSTDRESLRKNLKQIIRGQLVMHDPRPDESIKRHITDHLLLPVRELGIPVLDRMPRIPSPEMDYALADQVSKDVGGRSTVVLHPGGGSLRKRWPLRNFLELGRRLAGSEISTVWVSGPAEAELDDDVKHECNNSLFFESPPLAQLAGLLSRADLLVGNDSGPGHIAAAAGTSTVILFGPTDPEIWGPPHSNSVHLRAASEMLEELEVQRVLKEVLNALAAS